MMAIAFLLTFDLLASRTDVQRKYRHKGRDEKQEEKAVQQHGDKGQK